MTRAHEPTMRSAPPIVSGPFTVVFGPGFFAPVEFGPGSMLADGFGPAAGWLPPDEHAAATMTVQASARTRARCRTHLLCCADGGGGARRRSNRRRRDHHRGHR